MPKLVIAVLVTILSACASQAPAPATTSPYGSPDGQRERAEKATQELDRSAAQK